RGRSLERVVRSRGFPRTPDYRLQIVFFRRLVNFHGLIAGELRLLELLSIRLDDPLLDRLARGGVDGMRDVGVELDSGFGLADRGGNGQAAAAVVAELGADVVLAGAAGAALGDLPGRHRHEDALLAFDDLEVADDEGVVEGDGAESAELVAPAAD